MSRLIVPGDDVAAIASGHHRSAEEEIAAHYNFDLGLPYAARGGSLTRDLVLACRRQYRCPASYQGPAWVTAGVDVGAVLHVRISRWDDDGYAIPLYIGEIGDFEGLGLLFDAYNVNFGVVDERPEERKAREFGERLRRAVPAGAVVLRGPAGGLCGRRRPPAGDRPAHVVV